MKKTIVLLLFLLMSSLIFSEENMDEPVEDFDHYIGAGGGLTVGYGLNYRYWPERIGAQLTFAPFASGDRVDLMIGSTLFYELYETESTRLFLYGGGHYAFSSFDREIYQEVDPWDLIGTEHVVENNWGVGIGPGIELILFKNFAIDFMFGYGYTSSYNNLSFTAEGFLSYRF